MISDSQNAPERGEPSKEKSRKSENHLKKKLKKKKDQIALAGFWKSGGLEGIGNWGSGGGEGLCVPNFLNGKEKKEGRKKEKFIT